MRKIKSVFRRLAIFLAIIFTLTIIYRLSDLPLAHIIPSAIIIALAIRAEVFLLQLIQSKSEIKTKSNQYINQDGYYAFLGSNGLVHRYIAKKKLGRELKPNEVVHHINGKKTDNRLINLCVMDRESHEQVHTWLSWKKKKTGHYPTFTEQKRMLVKKYDGILLEGSFLKEPQKIIIPKPSTSLISDKATINRIRRAQ